MTQPGLDGLPADTPRAIRKLLRRCLEKDPRRRLRDIGEARVAIEDVLSGTATEEPTPVAATPAPSRRGFLPWIAAGLLLVALAALAWVHFREGPPAERSLRFPMPLPAKAQLQSLAVSPDGRHVAIAVRQETTTKLWIHSLDALEPRELAAAEGATYPFWSPDSRYIGFFAHGKLQKMTVDGGPPQVLCDAPDGRGGAWSKDGVIVFAPALNTGLEKVPAVGGVPVKVTQTKADHRFPILLPDGRHFLYVVSVDTADKNGIFLGSLDGQAPRKILADLSSVLYVPPLAGSRFGHLLFQRDDTLMAQPFDDRGLGFAGELFPVAQRIPFGSTNNYMLASSSENGVLVYRSGAASQGGNQLLWYERSGKPAGAVGAPGVAGGFDVSPDGKTVALARITGRSSDIWLHDLARGNETRFTFNTSVNIDPIWSPKGDRIVFASNRRGIFDLYQKAASGAGQDEILIESNHPKRPSQFSADGRFLLFDDVDPKMAVDIWTLSNPAGTAQERKPALLLQTEFAEQFPQLSPDGRWLAYASNESGRVEIYVRPGPGAPGEGKWKASTTGGTQPRWRRDGKELYYIAPDRKLMAVAVKTTAGPKAVFEAGTPEALFQTSIVLNTGNLSALAYSTTDGKRFLIETSGSEAPDQPLTAVVNWLAAAKK
jgi:Tol biopolymer transport system component